MEYPWTNITGHHGQRCATGNLDPWPTPPRTRDRARARVGCVADGRCGSRSKPPFSTEKVGIRAEEKATRRPPSLP